MRPLRRVLPRLLFVIVFASGLLGCGLLAKPGVRTIYVPAGTPVQLRERIAAARVWVADKDGQLIEGEMDLPEGWWVLEDDETKEK